jgi:hypothetical protein
VATLVGQRSPEQLRLYTIAARANALSELTGLPHQRGYADATDPEATASLLAGVRAEVEGRQSAGWSSFPEVLLVLGELAQPTLNQDLEYVLKHGRECGVRVLAATADLEVERSVLVDWFDSRIVFALEDEEASVRLLGKPWAITLAEPGRALARIGRRKEVELQALRLTDAGRDELLAQISAYELSHANDASGSDATSFVENGLGEAFLREHAAAMAEDDRDQPACTPESQADHVVPDMALAAPDAAQCSERVDPIKPPIRIAHLLRQAQLVVDCEDGSVWSRGGRLRLEHGSLLELFMYIAARPVLEQGAIVRWPGVSADHIMDEVWAPRARDATNRESGLTWLRKTLSRLQAEVSSLVDGAAGELVIEHEGSVRLNAAVVVSDVQAFLHAVERARDARGHEQVRAADEAVILRPHALLPTVPREGSARGRKFQIYGWLDLPEWERGARRLDALGLEAMSLLARAYRDLGQPAAAVPVYREILVEDPLDRRTQEGLLVAAAATRDVAVLDDAWKEIVAYLDGEVDADLIEVYERLMHESGRRTSPRNVERRALAG